MYFCLQLYFNCAAPQPMPQYLYNGGFILDRGRWENSVEKLSRKKRSAQITSILKASTLH
ncbi:MAG: hypothetical protein SXA11_00240 [Cyanobacteriota bacterium]|nr:hypothetical protein [Cyanobacteriota bacterium]